MYFDRFDICEAYYVYAMLWHGGQSSEEYKIFGRLVNIGFRPSPLLSGPEKLSENGLEIYNNLIAKED